MIALRHWLCLAVAGVLCARALADGADPLDPTGTPTLPNYTPLRRGPVIPPQIHSGPLRVFKFASAVTSVAFSADSRTLAAGDEDGLMWLWPVGSEELMIRIEGHRKGVRALAFSPQGDVLASGGGDGMVHAWNLKTMKAQSWLDYRHRGPATGLAYSSRGDLLFSSSTDDSVWVRDTVTGKKLMAYFGHSADVVGFSPSPDSRCVISGSADRSLQGWSLSTGEQVDFSTQALRVTAVALSKAGTMLASATTDGAIELRRTDGCTVHSPAYRLEYHTGLVRALLFSPDGKSLYSAGDDRVIVRWDLDAAVPVELFTAHQEAVTALAISADGSVLASAGRDRVLLLWGQGSILHREQPLLRTELVPSQPPTHSASSGNPAMPKPIGPDP